MRIILVLSFLFSFGVIAEAQQQPQSGKQLTLEEIEQTEKKLKAIEDAKEAPDVFRNAIETGNRKLHIDCLKSFGHKKFCECLSNNLAVRSDITLDLRIYIAVTTRTKKELGYELLPKQDQDLVDNAFMVREKCVKEIHGD